MQFMHEPRRAASGILKGERPPRRRVLRIDLRAVALAVRPLAGPRAPLARAVKHGRAAAKLGRLKVPTTLLEAGQAEENIGWGMRGSSVSFLQCAQGRFDPDGSAPPQFWPRAPSPPS